MIIGMVIIKNNNNNKKYNNCWQQCGEIGTLYTVVGNIKWNNRYEKQYRASSKKLKIVM